MKLLAISFLFSILLVSNVYAIRINEVDINPAGTDAGNEWVEFYNNGEISLEGYKIINNDGNNISLNGSFNGYFVYVFTKQWLDNSNESIYLYKDSQLIDQTDLLADSTNNDLTWQFCDGDWNFLNSTKGQINNCPIDEDEETSVNNESSVQEEQENTTQIANKTLTTPKTTSDFTPSSTNEISSSQANSSADSGEIFLSSKISEKDVFITKEEKLRLYIIYSFAAFV